MRILKTSLACLLCLPVLAVTEAWPQLPFSLSDGEKPTLAPLLREVMPSVVSISVEATVAAQPFPFESPFGDLFPFPEPRGPQLRQGIGSGVIIDAGRGHVLTNFHVIENADEIRVDLADGRWYMAEVIGSDPFTDIALLRIDADGLRAIEIGDSTALEVGDFVLAIGNPFGIGQTVTSGIVSALGRATVRSRAEGSPYYEEFIQTDAAINPGNSGGALIDLDGRLVGVNTAIVAPTGGNVGIGYAVPVSIATEIVAQLIEFGEVQRGLLGVRIQTVTPDLAEAFELGDRRGAVVNDVSPDSAAERAGIMRDDIITELNGEPVLGAGDLRNRIGLTRPGTDVRLTILRDDRELELTATLGAADSEVPVASAAPERRPGDVMRLEGARFGPIPGNHPRSGDVDGVLVTAVASGSTAERAGLTAGDIITAVNREPVTTVAELDAAIRATDGGPAALTLERPDGSRLFVVIR